MRWLLAGMLLTLTCSLSAVALGGTDDYENKKALAYLKIGTQRQEAGDCKGAISLFKRGIEHRPLPELQQHMEQCQKALAGGESTPAPSAATKPGRGKPAPVAASAPTTRTGGSSGDAGNDGSDDPFTAPAPAPAPSGPKPGAVEKCLPGQRRSASTGGHCCWPEQVWAADPQKGEKTGGQCIGTPTCPRGFKLAGKGCVKVDPTVPRKDGTCAEGRELVTDDRCCWPDQDWLDGECVGRPRCPRGYRRQGEDCLWDDRDAE